MTQAVNETKVLIQIVAHLFFVTAISIGIELKAVSCTIKPRCKVHWVRSKPCLSNPSAPGRNLPVRTIAQSVRRPGIERLIF